ncbi:DinB family protein [Fulvivirga lutea]|uniref:DinB family protein n=1 Tax=Fulvivirga lutea TaxID=2810512 RepID=A0A975A1M2_9BACT|nr:DinB family protein [Fulvivirga lutea]QSE97976.1 DinB family protein [Fulvivirga lutea]
MNAKVKEKFQSLEYQKEYLLVMTADVSEAQANKKFDEGQWSLAQTLFHLYLVEQKTFEDISKRIKNNQKAENVGIKEKFRHSLLKLFLKLPIKYKAPRTVSEPIPEVVNLEELKSDWANLRESFRLLLSIQTDSQLELKLFKHPRVGYLNLIQTIEFIKAHHKHHLAQIKRLLSNIQA